MNRFHFLLALMASLLLASLMVPPMASAVESQSPRPNIILIISDAMGWSDLGCHGGEIKTPQLDALAADGVRFTQ